MAATVASNSLSRSFSCISVIWNRGRKSSFMYLVTKANKFDAATQINKVAEITTTEKYYTPI